MSKIALITGATSGIGRATSIALAKDGVNLIITGRRDKILIDLANEIEREYQIKVLALPFDVRELSQVEQNLSNLPEFWRNIDILINNAGLAVGLNPLNSGVTEDWERMIDTNVKGLLYVSRVVAGLMIDRKRGGHIINIGSIAGKSVYPDGNVYCATKHAVDALSRAMSMDLFKHRIRVSQVSPGAVETEFSTVRFKGDSVRAANVYKGFTPLSAYDVAEVIRFVVNAPLHVNISDVVVMPSAQASATMINRED